MSGMATSAARRVYDWTAALTPGSVNIMAVAFVAANTAFNAAFHIPCPLHAETGLLCPLCGGTRALEALARGRIGSAVGYNALVVCSLPLVAALCALHYLRPELYRRVTAPARKHDMLASLLVFGGWFAVRNFPGSHF